MKREILRIANSLIGQEQRLIKNIQFAETLLSTCDADAIFTIHSNRITHYCQIDIDLAKDVLKLHIDEKTKELNLITKQLEDL